LSPSGLPKKQKTVFKGVKKLGLPTGGNRIALTLNQPLPIHFLAEVPTADDDY
jgi:hypothetical protein